MIFNEKVGTKNISLVDSLLYSDHTNVSVFKPNFNT